MKKNNHSEIKIVTNKKQLKRNNLKIMKSTFKIKNFFSLILIIINGTCIYSQHSIQVKKGETTFTIMGDTTKYNFKATWAKMEDRYADAAKFKILAIEKGESKKLDIAYYDAASYYAKAIDYKNTVAYIKKSIAEGWSDIAHLEYDKDFEGLRKTNEWNKMTLLFTNYYKSNNKQIAKIFAEDQKARLSGVHNENMEKEDSIRRVNVKKQIDQNKISSPHDYYKAAFIFHHGTSVEDSRFAHELALKAYKKENKHFRSPWLVAATKDRYLLRKGEKQWYGTQGIGFNNGKLTLNPSQIDTTAVSVEGRKKLNAPTIESIRKYIKAYKDNENK